MNYINNFKKKISILVLVCLIFSNLSVTLAMAATDTLSNVLTVDDNSNKIIGADETMEYSVDNGLTWISYDISDEPVFTGDQTVLIRATATESDPAGDVVSLIFTEDEEPAVTPEITPVVTPAAVSVTANDTENKIIGADETMEYSMDNGTTWVSYDINDEPVFPGDQTVLIRTTATESDPAGDVLTLIFTEDEEPTVTPVVTPAAVSVTVNDTENKIIGTDETMEYSVDNGTTWVSYDISEEPTFKGDQTVLIRTAAKETTPAGEITTLVFNNAAPVASDILLSGIAKLGNKITASYLYNDSDGDLQGSSIIQWYRADNAAGTNKVLITGASSLVYKVTKADQGKYLFFIVTPVALTGKTTGSAVSKSVKVAPNLKPEITKIRFSGIAKVGEKITATYTYQDADNDLQGSSVIKWYRADNAAGKNKKVISGANGLSYTSTKSDLGKFIIFEITPKAKTGVIIGTTVSRTTISSVKGVTYSAHIKLGVVGSKSYADVLANKIKEKNTYCNVVIKKEGKYYRIYADFVNKTAAEKTMKELKQNKYIYNYSYIK